MARRGAIGTSESAPKAGRSRGLGILTLLLTLYAAGVSTLLLFRGGGAGGAAGGKAAAKGDFDPDRIARDVQLAVQADLKRATTEQKELLGDAIRRVEALRTSLKEIAEAATRRSEEVSRASSGRAEVLDARINDLTQATDELKTTLGAIAAQVKALESRPVGSGPAAPAPGKTPAGPAPGPIPPVEPPPGPVGPTPEEIAANKAKVRAAIEDLASPDIGKVFAACLLLQSLKDLEAVEPLLKVLRDYKDPYGRTAAATALGNLRACDGVPGLIGSFLDKDPGVYLAASLSFTKITGQDSGLSGDASRKDKVEAKDKWTRWWKDHELEIRARWKQPKSDDGAPPGDAPK